jgi:hypothetical protein
MTELPACPNCDTKIENDAYNFCPGCQKQIRCTNRECRAELKLDSDMCFICGTPIKQLVSKQQMNTLVLEENYSEQTSSRRVELSVTDNAVDKIPGILAGFGQPINSGRRNLVPTNFQSNRVVGNALSIPLKEKIVDVESLSGEIPVEDSVDTINVVPTDLNEDETAEIVNHFFKKNADGSIVALDSLRAGKYGDTSGTNRWKARNLVLFFIVAYEHFTGNSPSKDSIYGAIREEKLFDSNFRDDFTKSIIKKYLSILGSNLFTLHFDGRKQLAKAVQQIFNPTEDVNGTRKRKRPAGRPKGSSTKKDLDLINPLLLIDTGVNEFDTRLLKTAREWAIFSVFIVKTKLKSNLVTKPSILFSYVSKKFENISVSKRAFTDSFSANGDFLKKSTSDGGYYLTSEGEKLVNELVLR